jgi:NAD(P)-dependent dehydrogenase (short-subunit alcohol dehydrogenase family)
VNNDKKFALITGGAKGIGKSISLKLASEGWDLILWGRDSAALDSEAESLKNAYGVQVLTRSLDLSDLASVPLAFEELSRQSCLPDALVCNAGSYGILGSLKDVNIEAWKKSFDLNFFSVAALIQQYLLLCEEAPEQKRRSIILLSGSGLGGSKVWPGISSYGCAKAAIYRLMEFVHEEAHISLKIDVNCIAPGAVKTGITEQAVGAGKDLIGSLFEASLKVVNEGGDSPELAAHVVSQLLSEACAGISGRLISAKWDHQALLNPEEIYKNGDLFRLRRIDQSLFVKGH